MNFFYRTCPLPHIVLCRGGYTDTGAKVRCFLFVISYEIHKLKYRVHDVEGKQTSER